MALNKVIIMGRITQDLEIKQTPNGVSALSFTVAVDRYSKNSEEKQADFISCVAWRQTAEFIAKYFGKGRMIAVTGNLHTRTYEDKNGTKHYVTEVYVDSADFTGEPRQGTQQAPQNGGNVREYNYTPAPPQTPQASAQPPQQANNGYPTAQMYASKADKPAPDTLGSYPEFEVFSDDGVPF